MMANPIEHVPTASSARQLPGTKLFFRARHITSSSPYDSSTTPAASVSTRMNPVPRTAEPRKRINGDAASIYAPFLFNVSENSSRFCLSGTAGLRGSRPASWQRFQDLKISSRNICSLNVSRRKKPLPCAKASFQLRICHWHLPPNRAMLLRSPLHFSEGCHALGGHHSSLMLKTDLARVLLVASTTSGQMRSQRQPTTGYGRRLFLLLPALSPVLVCGSKSSCQS
jgi:hypothetical protein